MAKELTDDELNLRRKARRRLIGAIALTLAVVVILPMVLESQPKPTGQDIDLRIPAPDKVGEFVPNVAISEVAVALPLAASDVIPASDVVAVSEPVAISAVASVADVAPKAVEPKAGEPKPVAQAASAQQATSVSGDTKKEDAAKKEDKAAAVTYAAQVGAYSNPNTAKQEVEKLKGWGFKAYTEKAGNKIRVRVGPYEERVKAEKVVKMLEKHGLHPSVVSIK